MMFNRQHQYCCVMLYVDMLILGVGNYEEVQKLNRNVIKHLRDHRISVEVLSTVSAAYMYFCYSCDLVIKLTKVIFTARQHSLLCRALY